MDDEAEVALRLSSLRQHRRHLGSRHPSRKRDLLSGNLSLIMANRVSS